MPTILKNCLYLLLFTLFTACSSSKVHKYGTIIYNIDMDDAAKKNGMDRNVGTKATARFNKKYLYLKHNRQAPTKDFQITDLKTGLETQYVSVYNQNFAVQRTAESLPALSKLTLSSETKEILGYSCKKATWEMNGQTAYVYLTDAIKPKYCPFVFQEFGFALEYQLHYPYGTFVYTASDANFNKVDKRLIEPPEDYKPVSPREYQAALFNRPKPSFIDKTAANFTLLDLNGNSIELEQLKGKYVFLNFWFINCPPCRKEIPDLNKLKKQYSGRNIEFVALTFNNEQDVRDFVIENPFDFRIGTNAREVVVSYGIHTYPTSLLVNPEGVIVGEHIGGSFNIYSELDNMLKQHLK